MDDRIDLAETLASLDEPYSPRIVARMNDLKVVVDWHLRNTGDAGGERTADEMWI